MLAIGCEHTVEPGEVQPGAGDVAAEFLQLVALMSLTAGRRVKRKPGLFRK